MLKKFTLLMSTFLLVALTTSLFAESLESQSNPVSNGALTADADRSDWEDIPWYEFDDDFTELYPVDIDRVQIAHDSTHVYFRLQTLEWDTEETWRVGTYIDTDQDLTTGYTGDFLPVGADHFVEDASAFGFTAATQAEWGWEQTGEAVRDQTDMLDYEMAVPRLAIGNPESFDFIMFANNFCCDFMMEDDIYPNEPGGFFTYEFGGIVEAIPGDCDGDGSLTAADLACVTTIEDRDVVLGGIGSLPGDIDGDGSVAFADFLVLSGNFGTEASSYTAGNLDLVDGVAFADFLILSGNFGQTAAAQTQAVPEPNGLSLLAIAGIGLLYTRRRSSL